MNSDEIVHLAETLAFHDGVTHWAISSRIFGRGDFFARLMDGRNCYQASIEKAQRWFHEYWPDDLLWPESIMRPDRQINLERA